MPKKNKNVPWRVLRNEELGFRIQTESSSRIGEDHDEKEQGNENFLPMEDGKNRNQVVLQQNSAGTEVKTNRVLANDILYIHQSEHPGMVLTTYLFDGSNFHNWCRSIKRGLVSRNKLGIVDGSMLKPRIDSIDYMQWMRVDYLVFNWINNSMTKEIARGFQNPETSHALWHELHRRFGKENGPMIYKVRRKIATFCQKNQSVKIYFNNLTGLWDELSLLETTKACVCEANEENLVKEENVRMMQFLMGFNDCFNNFRHQLLSLNPLPTVSQAYASILQVKEQINVSNQFAETPMQSAMYYEPKSVPKEQFKRRLTKEEKAKLRCDHFGGKGHIKNDCFELVGVLDWYKKFKTDKSKGKAHCATSKDLSIVQPAAVPNITVPNEVLGGEVGKLIQGEIVKHLSTYFKGLKPDKDMQSAHLAETGSGNAHEVPSIYLINMAFACI